MKIRECRELSDVLSNYDYTSKLGRDRWAWEFYRRDPEFRDIAHHYNAGDHVSRKAAPCRGVTLLKLRSAQSEAGERHTCAPEPFRRSPYSPGDLAPERASSSASRSRR